MRRIERAGLGEEKRVAVDDVRAGLGHDIDRAAGSAARFGRQTVVDDLKLADDLQRKLGAAPARVLVVVVQPVNREIVAAGAQTTESETTVRERRSGARRRWLSGARDAWREQYEVEIVATADRQLLDLFRFDGRGEGGLGRVDDRRLIRHRDRIRGAACPKLDVEASGLTDGEHDPGVLVGRKAILINTHLVSADHELTRAIKALPIGLHRASLIGLYVAQLDFSAGNDGAAAIGERALQSRGYLRDLSLSRGAQQGQERRDERRQSPVGK